MSESSLKARVAVLEAEALAREERFARVMVWASTMTSTFYREPDASAAFAAYERQQKQAQADREAAELAALPAWQRRAKS
jgi:hypothetical protein